MTHRLLAILRVLTTSRVRNNSFNIKLSYLFVKVKNSTKNRIIVVKTDNRWFLIFKISRNRRDNMFIIRYTGNINEFNPLFEMLNLDKMSNMINFWVYIYIWPKCMLSVTPSKKCCSIKSMSSIIEFISLNFPVMKWRDRKSDNYDLLFVIVLIVCVYSNWSLFCDKVLSVLSSFGSHLADDDGLCCRTGEFSQCHGLVKDLCVCGLSRSYIFAIKTRNLSSFTWILILDFIGYLSN